MSNPYGGANPYRGQPNPYATPNYARQSTRVFYRSPAAWFFGGAIGPVPQKTPGMIYMYISWGILAVIILLNLLLAVAGS